MSRSRCYILTTTGDVRGWHEYLAFVTAMVTKSVRASRTLITTAGDKVARHKRELHNRLDFQADEKVEHLIHIVELIIAAAPERQPLSVSCQFLKDMYYAILH